MWQPTEKCHTELTPPTAEADDTYCTTVGIFAPACAASVDQVVGGCSAQAWLLFTPCALDAALSSNTTIVVARHTDIPVRTSHREKIVNFIRQYLPDAPVG